MEHVAPNDDDVKKFVGLRVKINRADEEFVGVISGWGYKEGREHWVLSASNLTKAFIPSEVWEIYLCDGNVGPEVLNDLGLAPAVGKPA